ncbi:MAG: BolA/IbaG family iron-sulfur metabolism protein [Alphaproteobacteria bacterium]|nr:BolA/IbaG family iron-sulfur metabolism protein [Alphaproteobacteria bacterium]
MSERPDKELTDVRFGASRRARMKKALETAFSPTSLIIEDQSDRHQGHAGAQPGGETHFHITIVSSAFTGLNRVARQRRVMDALSAEFASGLHALGMLLKTPDEAA